MPNEVTDGGPPIVEIESLRYTIESRTIVDIPSWRMGVGEHCVVIGPSGSGKTTLLHLLAGISTPTDGHIAIDGQPLHALAGSALDAFRGRRIGVVFQTLHLLPALSVRDNLRLAQYLAKLPQDDRVVEETLAALGIADHSHRRPHTLSRGEAQRVAIARAVINRPKLVLADEPTSSLDDDSAAQVMDLLLEHAVRRNATLLVASHDGRIKSRFGKRLQLRRP